MRNNKHSLIIVLIIIIGVSLLNPLGFQIYVHAQGTAPALRVSVTIENVVDLACENLQVFVTNAGETNTFPISSSCSTGIISLLPGLYSAHLIGLGTADVISDTGCSGNVDSNSGIRECTFRVGFIQSQGQSELAEDVLGSPRGVSSGQVQDEQVEAVSQSEGSVLSAPGLEPSYGFLKVIKNVNGTTNDPSLTLRPFDYLIALYVFSGPNYEYIRLTEFQGSEKGWIFRLSEGTQYNVKEGFTAPGIYDSYSPDCEGIIHAGDNRTCIVTNTLMSGPRTLENQNRNNTVAPTNYT